MGCTPQPTPLRQHTERAELLSVAPPPGPWGGDWGSRTGGSCTSTRSGGKRGTQTPRTLPLRLDHVKSNTSRPPSPLDLLDSTASARRWS